MSGRDDDQLPIEIARRIDELCDAFESQLEARGEVGFSGYLTQVDPRGRRQLMHELAMLTHDWLQDRGHKDAAKQLLAANPSIEEELAPLIRDVTPTMPYSRASSANSVCHLDGESFGKYRLLRALGTGGMGSVYEAIDSQSGRRVALKVIKDSRASNRVRRRFLREGRLAAAISHPNSVYVYGTESIDGQLVIAMELVAGGALDGLLRESGRLSVEDAVDAILDVIAGLDAAHQQGILHRDIKPSNCFRDVTGRVKIGDYGLSVSSMIDAQTLLTHGEGFALGTPQFASPEQLRGEELDVRSDIYSVGATLYCMLSGHPPFDDKRLPALIAKVIEEPAPKLPSDCRAPKRLAQLVERCLAKQPESRYQSYPSLRKALKPFSSRRATAAFLDRRTLAYIGDFLLAEVACDAAKVALAVDWLSLEWDKTRYAFLREAPLASNMTGTVVYISYFWLLEWRWGTTVGKRLLGMRVEAASGGRPGAWQALARAAVFELLTGGLLILPVLFLCSREVFVWWVYATHAWELLAYAVLGGACFAFARKSNGWRGLHEWVSGTRTTLASSEHVSPASALGEASHRVSEEKIGPYCVLEESSVPALPGVTRAYDPLLQRELWILHRSKADDAAPANRRDLARPGRLRWLNGDHNLERPWDAYEAVSGSSPFGGEAERLPWRSLVVLLHSLSVELEAAVDEAQLPADLELQQTWLGEAGRVVLLDFNFKARDAEEPLDERRQRARNFLREAAEGLLEAGASTSPPAAELGGEASCRIPIDVPYSLRQALRGLNRPGETLPVSELEEAIHKPRRLTVGMRIKAALVFIAVVAPVFLATASEFFLVGDATENLLRSEPTIGQLVGLVDLVQEIDAVYDAREGEKNVWRRRQVAEIIRREFGHLVEDQSIQIPWQARAIFDKSELLSLGYVLLAESSSTELDPKSPDYARLVAECESCGWTLERLRRKKSDEIAAGRYREGRYDSLEELLEQRPEIGRLEGFIDYYERLLRGDPAVLGRVARAVIHDSCSERVIDPNFRYKDGVDWLFDEADWRLIEAICDSERPVALEHERAAVAAEVSESTERLGWTADEYAEYVSDDEPEVRQFLIFFLVIFTVIGALLSIGGAVAVRGFPFLKSVGLLVITKDGEIASRLRVFLRNLIQWLCVSLVVGATYYAYFKASPVVTDIATCLAYGVIVALFIAREGPHDWLTKTRIAIR